MSMASDQFVEKCMLRFYTLQYGWRTEKDGELLTPKSELWERHKKHYRDMHRRIYEDRGS
jgi:hypothetical protein